MDNFYFIYGTEEFLIDDNIRKVILALKDAANDEPEVVVNYGDELSPESLMEVLDFSPLFNLRRVLVIKRIPWLGGGKRKNMAENYFKILENYRQSPPEGQTVILTANELPAKSNWAKFFNKKAEVIKCDPLDKEHLSAWIKNTLAERQIKINADALNMLVSSKINMYSVKNLLDKLALMNLKGKISKQDIENELPDENNVKIFRLLDALVGKNLPSALNVFQQLLQQGEPPLAFLFMIVRQFVLLGKVKAFQEAGLEYRQIVELTGQRDFVIRNLIGKSSNFSWDELAKLNRLFLQTDVSLKTTGQNPDALLENLIIEICTLRRA
ncbi:MAG: DNA polymerase III subunit delta [Syntrophomonadaceae bacterium]|jgi:DNA polymerase-3 subunit delta|nr:DNA polymerase III subunit delta [Syntrophomonadaceae bacterium]